jgi:hypothetical protein
MVSSPLVCKLVLMGACGVGYILMSICRFEGLTVVRFEMVPCGVNVPHTHPRASELLSLISGGPLQVGFIDTLGE